MSSSEHTSSICKRRIESLEIWLRRLINDVLTKEYGEDYFNATMNGQNIVNSRIRGDLQERQTNNPGRFARLIDATLLNHLIDISCNPVLFNKHFDAALRQSFDDVGNLPSGHRILKNNCMRLLEPRNRLFHSNAISERQAEQLLCITGDLTDSLKSYYRENGMEQDFNSPLILSVVDNKGVKHYREKLQKSVGGGIVLQLHNRPEYYLYPGDTVSIAIDVDGSFDGEYKTICSYRGTPQFEFDKHFTVEIKEEHIGIGFQIAIDVLNTNTNKKWSRMPNSKEDNFWVKYKVLPNR